MVTIEYSESGIKVHTENGVQIWPISDDGYREIFVKDMIRAFKRKGYEIEVIKQ